MSKSLEPENNMPQENVDLVTELNDLKRASETECQKLSDVNARFTEEDVPQYDEVPTLK